MSNTRSDWPTLRRQYVEGDMSLRALAIENDIPTSSLIARSKSDGWQEERRKLRTGVTVRTLDALIDGQAEDLISARGEAIDALRKGLARFVSDLLETKPVRRASKIEPDGTVTEWELAYEPIVRVTPRDLAILIDKVNILSGQPSSITRLESESNVHVSAAIDQLPAEVLAALAAAAGDGLSGRGAASGSPLPRIEDPDPARNGA